jgi:hypothetical protein
MEHKKEEEESSIAHELAEVVVVAGKVEKGACCCMRSCIKGWSLFLNACEAVYPDYQICVYVAVHVVWGAINVSNKWIAMESSNFFIE